MACAPASASSTPMITITISWVNSRQPCSGLKNLKRMLLCPPAGRKPSTLAYVCNGVESRRYANGNLGWKAHSPRYLQRCIHG